MSLDEARQGAEGHAAAGFNRQEVRDERADRHRHRGIKRNR